MQVGLPLSAQVMVSIALRVFEQTGLSPAATSISKKAQFNVVQELLGESGGALIRIGGFSGPTLGDLVFYRSLNRYRESQPIQEFQPMVWANGGEYWVLTLRYTAIVSLTLGISHIQPETECRRMRIITLLQTVQIIEITFRQCWL